MSLLGIDITAQSQVVILEGNQAVVLEGAVCTRCGLAVLQIVDAGEYDIIKATGLCMACSFDDWLDSLTPTPFGPLDAELCGEPLDEGSTTPLNDTFPPEDD